MSPQKENEINGRVYVVEEQWPNQQVEDGKFDTFMFYQPKILFSQGTPEERKKKTLDHLRFRFQNIAIRKGMFSAIEKLPFTVTLSYRESIDGMVKEEILMKVNEKNYPVPPEMHQGLYTVKERYSLEKY